MTFWRALERVLLSRGLARNGGQRHVVLFHEWCIMLNSRWALAFFAAALLTSIASQSVIAQSNPNPTSPTNPEVDSRKTVTTYVQQGDRAFAEGDFKGAVAAYTQALQLYSVNDYVYYNRGNAYRKLKDYKNAIADYTKAIELNPQNSFAYLYRGMMYQADNAAEAAIADYTVLLKLNDQDPKVYFRRAEAYASLKQKEAAVADFRKASELYRKQGEPALSEKMLSQMRSL
jgi:tetratricopeptide (TPR) repeat protein